MARPIKNPVALFPEPPQKASEVLYIKITERQKAAVVDVARRDGVSLSDLVRQFVRQGLEARGVR